MATKIHTITNKALHQVTTSLCDIENLLSGIELILQNDIDDPERELIRAAVERAHRLKSETMDALPNGGDVPDLDEDEREAA